MALVTPDGLRDGASSAQLPGTFDTTSKPRDLERSARGFGESVLTNGKFANLTCSTDYS